MCHLCGWRKLFLKKCGGGKNKKYRVGKSVVLLVVRLQYFYVFGQLSKWFVFVLMLNFRSVVVVGTVVLSLAITSYVRNPKPKKTPFGCAKPSILVRYAQPKALFRRFLIAYKFWLKYSYSSNSSKGLLNSSSVFCVICVYISVVLRLLCPNSCCITLRLTPFSSAWVAKQCRRV